MAQQTRVYIIDNTAGSNSFSIQPRTMDGAGGVRRTTDLTLYGNAALNWGERFNENFYKLLETFACPEHSTTPGIPADDIDIRANHGGASTDSGLLLGINFPTLGQLWYNTTNQSVYVCVNPSTNEWKLVGGSGGGGGEDPDPEIPGIPENVQLALNGKVNKIGDTMTGKLIINGSTTLDDVLELRSNDGPVITLKTTSTTFGDGTSPVLRFYNPNNDPSATGGSAQGVWGWTKVTNRTGHIFSVERTANDNGNTPAPSGGVAEVLTIYQNGEMVFFGQGSGTHSGDIRLPNATFGLADHVVTKQYVEDFVMGVTPTSEWKTGDIRTTIRTVADPGWVLMNDGTIGNGSSAATNRANIDTKDLFELLWNTIDDTWCPVSGGRGGSATADFNANKTIQLPRALGRVLANQSVTHVLGKYMGAETHNLTANENGSHTHTGSGRTNTDGAHTHTLPGTYEILDDFGNTTDGPDAKKDANAINVIPSTGSAHAHNFSFTTNSSGTGAAHNNMQPSVFVQFQMKL